MGQASDTSSGAERIDPELVAELEKHRRELTGYCYRMLGGAFDAEDAVQETLLRAWRSYDRFEGRSSLRTWLYRIAGNVCLDMLGSSRAKRERPMGLGAASAPVVDSLAAELPEERWIEPIPDDRVLPGPGDPADTAIARESVRLAFVAALQGLPPKQRAVLVLREVLRWSAQEVADLLETTVASVNSALQRARATLSDRAFDLDAAPATPRTEPTPQESALLERYIDAFERYDMDGLSALLREDAVMNMPPYAMWLQGTEDIRAWLLGVGSGCRGSRLVPVRANGSIAYGQYRPDPEGGWFPWGLAVLENDGEKVTGITTFVSPERMFPLFGLPDHLD
jgi:RNA polymerase sigma-70 factor (ECF subfamily)